jgi:hypothetical protein
MYLSASEIKRLLHNWQYFKANSSPSGVDALSKKVNAIERAMEALPELDGKIVTLKYVQHMDGDGVAACVHMSRQLIGQFAFHFRVENQPSEQRV